MNINIINIEKKHISSIHLYKFTINYERNETKELTKANE